MFRLKIWYSWGDEEPSQTFDSFDEAWEKAKTMAVNEVAIVYEEHGSFSGLAIDKAEGMITLQYNYDGTECYYKVEEVSGKVLKGRSASQVAGDVKWFMFDDESMKIVNEKNFDHDLKFVDWTSETSFVVMDEDRTYLVSVDELSANPKGSEASKKFSVKIPGGYLIVEEKGTEKEYPGVYVFYSKDEKEFDESKIVTCVEFDSCAAEIRTETYQQDCGIDCPTAIIRYFDGEDLV